MAAPDPPQFRVPYPDRLTGPTPPYQKPTEILSYSLDNDRRICYDDRGLSCYYEAPLGTCLFDRFETFKARDITVNEHLDNLLLSLVHAKASKALDLTKQPRFITFRGLLTRIMCLPFQNRDDWEFGATRYNGTIYIEEHLTEARLRSQPSTQKHKLLTYSGYRFETVSTVPVEPSAITGPDDPRLTERHGLDTNNMAEFNVVFRTKLGNHSILFGAEIDCVSHGMHKDGRSDRYMELKTSGVMTNRKGRESFQRYKLLKFYIQSYLAAIPKIVVGFRDDRGYLRKHHTFDTLKIPRIVRDQRFWDPAVCFRFADQFLSWLETVISVDDPYSTYTIRYDSTSRNISVLFKGQESGHFLPPAFVDAFAQWEA